VDAETGKAYWTQDTGSEIWASPLIADHKLFVGTRKGEFLILGASREKRILQTIMLDGAISGTATAANGVLFIATANRLYAIAHLADR
jgi:outer membrane protein assembly factor BamB